MFDNLRKRFKRDLEFNPKEYFENICNKGEKVPIVFFYEEVPICEKIKIKDIDYEAKSILLQPERKLLKAVAEIKDIFFKIKHGEKNIFLKSKVIYGGEEGIEITFPESVEDDKIFRLYLRVKVCDKKPIYVDIFERDEKKNEKEDTQKEKENSKKKERLYIRAKATDISETGIGVIIKKSQYENDKKLKEFVENIKENEIYDLKIYLPSDTVETKGNVVKIKDEEKYKKLGITFVDIDLDSREKIFKYIFERQKEILKELNDESF